MRQFRPDSISYSCRGYGKMTQVITKYAYKYPILPQSQNIFYVRQDYGCWIAVPNMNKIHPFIAKIPL